MKMISLIVLFLLGASFASANPNSASSRSNGLLKFLAQDPTIRNFALGTVLNNRCNRYMIYSEVDSCKAAVKRMIQLLDFDIIFTDESQKKIDDTWNPKSFVFVAFKSNLIHLLNTPKITAYLSNLNQELYRYLTGETETFNIWNFTKTYYKSDYLTAAVLAVLFQDTSRMKLHLGYLEQAKIPGNAHFVSNKELLGRVIDTVNQILDTSEDHYRKLFYPAEIEKNLNRNIYHFYVPLFLSMSLKNEKQHGKFAYYAPLMMTLSYEFITTAADYRYLYNDPERIDPATSAGLWKLKDIFGGYCGANFGVRGMTFNKNFLSITEAFARSTADGVELLLRH